MSMISALALATLGTFPFLVASLMSHTASVSNKTSIDRYEIRQVRDDDKEAVVEVVWRAFTHGVAEGVRMPRSGKVYLISQWWGRHGHDGLSEARSHTFVAVERATGRVVSVAHGDREDDLVSIAPVATHPDFYGQGLAKTVTTRLILHLQRTYATTKTARGDPLPIVLSQEPSNASAFLIYYKLGLSVKIMIVCLSGVLRLDDIEQAEKDRIYSKYEVGLMRAEDIPAANQLHVMATGMERRRRLQASIARSRLENPIENLALAVHRKSDRQLVAYNSDVATGIGHVVSINDYDALKALLMYASALDELQQRHGMVVLFPMSTHDELARWCLQKGCKFSRILTLMALGGDYGQPQSDSVFYIPSCWG